MKTLHDIWEALQKKQLDLSQAEAMIKSDYLEHLDGMVQLDIFRHRRTGIPEAVFAETKSSDLVLKIRSQCFSGGTRISPRILRIV